jgi:predicted amidophosphoribosyltransferase
VVSTACGTRFNPVGHVRYSLPRCSSCGEWVEEDQRLCGYCGLKIPDETDGSR